MRAYLSTADRPRAPLKSGRTLGSHELKGTDPRTEPKKYVKNVAERGRRSGFRVVARWWLSLVLGLGLLGVFPPGSWFGRFFFLLCVFSFLGDGPRTDHFRLATAGVTLQLPDGRDVGSKHGHRPKNWYLQVSPCVRRPGVSSSTNPCRSSSTCYDQAYLGVQLPSCSFQTKLDTSPYTRASNALSRRLHDPGGETAVLRNNAPQDDTGRCIQTSSSIPQLEQVGRADHLSREVPGVRRVASLF